MISITDVNHFIDGKDYDLAISRNGRWIDQKCTFDVVFLVANCIREYCKYDLSKSFSVNDIWGMEYAAEKVTTIFGKPDPSKKSSNEYDKYFGQPIKMLDNAGVLSSEKRGNRYKYKIANAEIMEYICFSEKNCLDFLCLYIEKVLRDSRIYAYFERFFDRQDKDSFTDMKNGYANYIISNTPINGTTECGRIFTKVLNPLAFKYHKCGTERGHISDGAISKGQLLYNQQNWRDILANKPKDVERSYHEDALAIADQRQIEYEPGFFISLDKLAEAGFGQVEINRFNTITEDFGKRIKYYTAKMFVKSGVETPADELGFDEYFYQSLMKRDSNLYWLQIDDTFIFSTQRKFFNLKDFLVDVINEREKIAIEELIYCLNEEYGIEISKQVIMNRIKDSDVYYDDILCYLYSDYEKYYQDV